MNSSELGSSAVPVAFLSDTLSGSENRRTEAAKATISMFVIQDLIFDILRSHLNSSAIVMTRACLDDMAISGVRHGKPA